MEIFLLMAVLVGVAILSVPFLWYAVQQLRRDLAAMGERLTVLGREDALNAIRRRITAIETTLERLQTEVARAAVAAAPAAFVSPASVGTFVTPPAAPFVGVPDPTPAPVTPSRPAAAPVTPIDPPDPAEAAVAAQAPWIEPIQAPATPAARVAEIAAPVPVPVPAAAGAAVPAAAAAGAPRANLADPAAKPELAVPSKPLEERLVEWLTKFGAVIVFLGLAAAASYFWDAIGIWGRVLLFLSAGGAMLGAGLALEKKDRYRVLGRSLVGGGWATVFMTTFGIHHIEAIRVVASLEIDLALVLAVTAAMVWDTLRYDSRWVTGLAFGLGFYTVAQSHVSAWSLLANVMLAGGLIVVASRRRWYDVEVIGLVASYGNHLLWLRPHVDAQTVPALGSAAVLAAYWTGFRASYVWREVRESSEEVLSSAGAILNTVLLLGVAYYQATFSRDFGFWAFLALGVIEMGLARLVHTRGPAGVSLALEDAARQDGPRLARSRRTAFLVLSSLGCLLVIAATPVAFVASPRVLLWALTAQAFLFAASFTGEWLFRRFGFVAALLAAGYAIVAFGMPTAEQTMRDGLQSSAPMAIGWLFAVVSILSYVDAHLVRAPAGGLPEEWEEALPTLLSFLAGASLLLALVVLVPASWTAVSLGVAVCALLVAGTSTRSSALVYQAHLIAIAAVAHVHAVNGDASTPIRALSFAGVAAAVYVASEFVRRATDQPRGREIGNAYTWLATSTVASLLFLETRDWRTAPAWVVLALAAGIIGRRAARPALNQQALALGAAVVAQAIAVNLQSDAALAFGIGTRVASVAFCAAALYLLQRFAPATTAVGAPADATATAGDGPPLSLAPLFSWGASLLVSWLLWYELPPAAVALGWALFGLVLFEAGMSRRAATHSALRHQAYVAQAAAFAQVLIVNLNRPETLWFGAAPIAPIVFYLYMRLTAGAVPAAPGEVERTRVAPALAWLGSLTVFVTLKFVLPADFVVLGWSACSTALAFAALASGRRILLDQAITGVGPVVFRGLMFNVYETRLSALGSSPGVGLVGAAVILLLALPALLRLRDSDVQGDALRKMWRRPDRIFFFAAVTLVTVVLAYLLPGVSMTLAWGVEAAAIFAFGLALRERTFRLTALGLLVVCVLKIGAYDVWNFADAVTRILTLVALGVILLGVSFLYGRFRERVRELL
jgi:hypothetical protein